MSDDESKSGSDSSRVGELCRAAAAGDPDALESLLAMHHAQLLGAAKRRVGLEWRDRIDAEDLLQEAYVDAFGRLEGFECRDGESFYRWMRRIVESRFIDAVRHWTAKKRGAGRAAASGDVSRYDGLLDQCHPDTKTPSMFVRRDEARGALLSCVARLPDEYRVVVQRVLLQEEPYEKAAEELGKSPEAVRRMASRAVEKLRECLLRASVALSRM